MLNATKIVVLIVAAISLTACISVKRTYTKDGDAAYSIACGAWTSDWRACLVKAGRICAKKGYVTTYADEVDRLLVISCRRTDDSG
jgi:hypothetical protein